MPTSKEPLVIETASAAETIEAGRKLASLLPSEGLVLLIGNLGAGKTTLVKGIAAERTGCSPAEVTSPTFTLIHQYGDPPTVYHIDLYRLETAAQVQAIGIEDLLDEQALVLIEWGERFPDLWPPDHCQIRLAGTSDHRSIEFRQVILGSPRGCQGGRR